MLFVGRGLIVVFFGKNHFSIFVYSTTETMVEELTFWMEEILVDFGIFIELMATIGVHLNEQKDIDDQGGEYYFEIIWNTCTN